MRSRRALLISICACALSGQAQAQGEAPALVNAAIFDDVEALTRQLKQSPTQGGRDQALHAAVVYGNVRSMEALVAAGANVNASVANARNGVRSTAFLTAVDSGKLDMVEIALRAGADLSSRNSDGQTALVLAAWRGHAAVLRRLLGAPSAQVDARDLTGYTPLLQAVVWGGATPQEQVAVVRELLAHGANPNAPFLRKPGLAAGGSPSLLPEEGTPLALAVARRLDAVATLLRAAGGRMSLRE